MKRETLILYRGPSKLTGEPILAILQTSTDNAKTGALVSVTIVPDPSVARSVRPHASVCPSACPFRDTGGCYVNWAFGPNALQKAHGHKPECTAREAREISRGRTVRLGMAGDPAAVPMRIWRNLLTHAAGWVGYTHAWRDGRFRTLRDFCMASVESEAEARDAHAAGWRTYRVRARGADTMHGEVDCPSARGVQCVDCGLCSGSTGKAGSAPSISIPAHGGAVASMVANRIAQEGATV